MCRQRSSPTEPRRGHPMIRAIRTGESGLSGQQSLIDVTANNVANANTTAFKRSTVGFQDALYATLNQPGLAATQALQSPTGTQIGNGAVVADISHIFAQGSLASRSGSRPTFPVRTASARCTRGSSNSP